jgi:rhomboid protease GluP
LIFFNPTVLFVLVTFLLWKAAGTPLLIKLYRQSFLFFFSQPPPFHLPNCNHQGNFKREMEPTVDIPQPDPIVLPPPPRQPSRFSYCRATYTLMAINLLVYALMLAFDGHQPLPAGSWQHNVLGSLNAYLTPSEDGTFLGLCANWEVVHNGQWGRLISAMFMHLGPLHIATNMWCLWNLGLIGEPLLGAWGLFVVYLLTGLGGNILSAGTHPDIASIGASGAVMGLAGVLVGLLRTRYLPIPAKDVRGLRRSVLLFAVLNLALTPSYNLLSGVAHWFGLHQLTNMLPGTLQIDDMAHLGGFLSGFVMGKLLIPRIRLHRDEALRRQRIIFPSALVVLVLLALVVTALWR